MESTGARLKKIRLEKGLNLEEVHKKTKLHLNILKAIEEDNLIGLNPVYLKGFLKIYCKFLGVDPKDYIAGYQEPQGMLKPIPQSFEKSFSLLKAASEKLSFFRAINIKTVSLVILALVLSVSLFKLGRSKSISSQKRKAHAVVPKQQRPTPPAVKNKTISTTIRLGLRAKEDCWVHLTVDGKAVFHTILKKGKFETWQANQRMELSLGNAGVIELELNGRIIPPLGRRGQVIKNILINKEEGLVVKR